MSTQLKLDFNGKGDNIISFRSDDDLKKDLEYLTRILNRKSSSSLVKEYVIECVSRDIGILRIKEARGEMVFVSI